MNSSTYNNQKEEEDDDDDDVPLPGFRFHPTDEELLGFYLRRKVEKRPTSIELIKHVDIYKYDPWDLPTCKGAMMSNVGDKEWYFYCKRGRKYKNSIRPNRVTASGFWKATGIDRPVYTSTSTTTCIGLKKSLVFYRGTAGKGTKTDWMMHEFRLPPPTASSNSNSNQEAEVWTLCRILKRNLSYKKQYCMPHDDHMITKQPSKPKPKPCSSSSLESDNTSTTQAFNIINFGDPPQKKKKQEEEDLVVISDWNCETICTVLDMESSSNSNLMNNYNYCYNNIKYWDTLSSVVDCCFSSSSASASASASGADLYHPFQFN